jgi:hypothetical protein
MRAFSRDGRLRSGDVRGFLILRVNTFNRRCAESVLLGGEGGLVLGAAQGSPVPRPATAGQPEATGPGCLPARPALLGPLGWAVPPLR